MIDADTILTISQDKTFRFLVYDKQAKQAGGNILSPYMRRAAYRIKDATDLYVAGLYVDASSANLIGTDASPKVPNTTVGDVQNVFNLIEDCACFSQQQCSNRWQVHDCASLVRRSHSERLPP